MEYKIIDMDTWPRKSHWTYYRTMLKAAISVTKRIDVTSLLSYCRKSERRFSAVLLHRICRAVNSMECTRMFALEDGNPAVWNLVHPNYTIFHKDDQTFSDLWIEYSPDEEAFLKTFDALLKEYGDRKGIKVRDGQPPNFFCVSGAPWLDYDSLSTYTTGERPPALFPILNYGKYHEENGKVLMPFTIAISHAAMDGYHIATFFEALQEEINRMEEEEL